MADLCTCLGDKASSAVRGIETRITTIKDPMNKTQGTPRPAGQRYKRQEPHHDDH